MLDQPTKPPVSSINQPTPNLPTSNVMPTAPPSQPPKSHRLLYTILSILGLIEIGSIVLYWVAIVFLVRQAKAGTSGTELMALGLIPVVLAGAVAALIAVIIGLFNLIKHKPRGKLLILTIAVMLPSLLYASFVTYQYFGFKSAAKYSDTQLQQDLKKLDQQLSDNRRPTTLADATTQLEQCKITQYHRGATDGQEDPSTSPSGIVVVWSQNTDAAGQFVGPVEPWRMSVTPQADQQLHSVFVTAQKHCPDLQSDPY